MQQDPAWLEERRDQVSVTQQVVLSSSSDEEEVEPASVAKAQGLFSLPCYPTSSCLQEIMGSQTEFSIYSDTPEDSFRGLFELIARFSSFEAIPAISFPTSRVVRLPAEKVADRQHSLLLNTSRSLIEMQHAWFDEFRRRDPPTDKALPFGSMFKAKENRPSLRLFESADALLVTEVASNPPSIFPWIVHPQGRFAVRECDVWHLETQSRICLRVLNFAVASCEAIMHEDISPSERDRVLERFPLVLRSLVQIQSAVLCELVQLRRDRFLSLLKNIPTELVQELRHCPLGQSNELFPLDLLKEINAAARDQWHNSAMLRVAEHASLSNTSGAGGNNRNPKGFKPKGKRQSTDSGNGAAQRSDHVVNSSPSDSNPSVPTAVHLPQVSPTVTQDKPMDSTGFPRFPVDSPVSPRWRGTSLRIVNFLFSN